MSYERQNSMTRLEQYRKSQSERIEAMSRAIDEGRTTVIPSTVPLEQTLRREVHWTLNRPFEPIPLKLKANTLYSERNATSAWVGSRKSFTAASVETSFRQPIRVAVAAPIGKIGPQNDLRHGQFFVYDAESRTMIPVKKNTVVTGKRRQRVNSPNNAVNIFEVKNK